MPSARTSALHPLTALQQLVIGAARSRVVAKAPKAKKDAEIASLPALVCIVVLPPGVLSLTRRCCCSSTACTFQGMSSHAAAPCVSTLRCLLRPEFQTRPAQGVHTRYRATMASSRVYPRDYHGFTKSPGHRHRVATGPSCPYNLGSCRFRSLCMLIQFRRAHMLTSMQGAIGRTGQQPDASNEGLYNTIMTQSAQGLSEDRRSKRQSRLSREIVSSQGLITRHHLSLHTFLTPPAHRFYCLCSSDSRMAGVAIPAALRNTCVPFTPHELLYFLFGPSTIPFMVLIVRQAEPCRHPPTRTYAFRRAIGQAEENRGTRTHSLVCRAFLRTHTGRRRSVITFNTVHSRLTQC